MRTAAVLPVKSFGSAKERLASALGAGSRQALAQAMFLDVLATLRRTRSIDQIVIAIHQALDRQAYFLFGLAAHFEEPGLELFELLLEMTDDAFDGLHAAYPTIWRRARSSMTSHL